ncbi:putative RNA/DNA demethylase ALKBH6 [Tubulanus polymorphus]|uniref:putative RNA/DNA demethylase ALKBH6 n=1 Tax=Tubulanus polymorphus TaxID=672921 RepID=UPI003DA6286B
MHQVYAAPKPKWTQLLNRRLQNWGGLPHPKGMVCETLPPWLEKYCRQIGDLGVFSDKYPNHVLVNEYKPGQGIMPHEDGSLFYPTVTTITLGSHTVLDFYQHISQTEQISVQNKTDNSEDDKTERMKAEETSFNKRHCMSLLLEPRSLVILQEDLYKTYLHGIQEITHDTLTEKVSNLERTKHCLGETIERSTRISLTIRHVPKVLKTKLIFGAKKK